MRVTRSSMDRAICHRIAPSGFSIRCFPSARVAIAAGGVGAGGPQVFWGGWGGGGGGGGRCVPRGGQGGVGGEPLGRSDRWCRLLGAEDVGCGDWEGREDGAGCGVDKVGGWGVGGDTAEGADGEHGGVV